MRPLPATTFLTLALLTTLHLTAAAPPGSCPVRPQPPSNTLPAAPPSTTLASGAQNPYYPCGASASAAAACPYRCYSVDTSPASAAANATSSTTTSPPRTTLLDACFDAPHAARMLATQRYICVACLAPPSTSTSTSTADESCTPLNAYLDSTSPPSPCGSRGSNLTLTQCAYLCAEAQVPFELCDANDTSSAPLRTCEACEPMCASPALAFADPSGGSGGTDKVVTAAEVGFDLSSGECSADAGAGGGGGLAGQERVACPWRCKAGGSPYAGCRMEDVSGREVGTTCVRCG